MSDWYVSSAQYALLTAFQASHAYSIGDFMKPTAPTVQTSMVYRCTTAGTSSTEPSYASALSDGGTVTSGGATFTNVTGRSTYGWSAAAGTLIALVASAGAGNNRIMAGDRCFISSDHSETVSSGSATYETNNQTNGFGLAQFISVNRAGSVPPVAADVLSGASITSTATFITLDAYCNAFWQGISFSSASHMYFNFGGTKQQYFKNCAFVLTSSSTNIAVRNCARIIWDNCSVNLGVVGNTIQPSSSVFELLWINTATPIVTTIPTVLFNPTLSGYQLLVTCRGVDFSLLNTTLLNSGNVAVYNKVLLDSCKIASGVTRFALGSTTASVAHDEIELVNCYDGTQVVTERHTPAGDVTIDRTTYLTSGAADDTGNYSLKLVSSARSDFATMPLDAFAFDVENTVTGSSKTATVEIVSSGALNNNDIRLILEYMGGVGSTWNPADQLNMVLSNSNLTALNNGSNAWVRGTTALGSTGKWYFEITSPNIVSTATSYGIASSTASNPASSSSQCASWGENGYLFIDNNLISSYGALPLGGTTVGIAVDMPNRLLWYWRADNNTWINAGNPATGANGFSISTLTAPIYPLFNSGGTSGSNDKGTFNPGTSAFVNSAVPAGFSPLPVNTTSSIASFRDSLPSVLTAASALPSSSNTWTTNSLFATWDPTVNTSTITYSNGNLTVTSKGSAGGSQPPNSFSSGKYYWEIIPVAMAGAGTAFGISLFGQQGNGQTGTGYLGLTSTGNINCNAVFIVNIGGLSATPVGIAVDLTNHLVWMRNGPVANWNASGTANPATGVGGITISSGASAPDFYSTTNNDAVTANFGASAFNGIVPSGFTAGWPGTPSKQLLQVTFTPQRAGRVRGLVRLGKVSSTVWVDPRLTIT